VSVPILLAALQAETQKLKAEADGDIDENNGAEDVNSDVNSVVDGGVDGGVDDGSHQSKFYARGSRHLGEDAAGGGTDSAVDLGVSKVVV
jgi:hypothetical protein